MAIDCTYLSADEKEVGQADLRNRKSWESADRLQPQLLDSAAHQVELSRAAYKRVYEMVKSRRVAR